MTAEYSKVSVSHARLIELPHHFEENGDLVVMERPAQVPFKIERVFVVRAPADAIRGQHAHKRCAQFMVCTNGCVEIVCDDGTDTATFVLNRPELALLVPATLWAQQTYLDADSVLTVLCDHAYEAADYIRDYAEFKAFRRNARSKT